MTLKSAAVDDLSELSRFLRGHLLHDIIPFWERHGFSSSRSGMDTCLSDDGTLISEDRYLWSQLRAIWTFITAKYTITRLRIIRFPNTASGGNALTGMDNQYPKRLPCR